MATKEAGVKAVEELKKLIKPTEQSRSIQRRLTSISKQLEDVYSDMENVQSALEDIPEDCTPDPDDVHDFFECWSDLVKSLAVLGFVPKQ